MPPEGEGAGDDREGGLLTVHREDEVQLVAAGRRQRDLRADDDGGHGLAGLLAGDRDDLRLLAAGIGGDRPAQLGRDARQSHVPGQDRGHLGRRGGGAAAHQDDVAGLVGPGRGQLGRDVGGQLGHARGVGVVGRVELRLGGPCALQGVLPGLGDPGVDQAVRDLLVEVGPEGQDDDQAEQHGRDDDAELQRRAPQVAQPPDAGDGRRAGHRDRAPREVEQPPPRAACPATGAFDELTGSRS